MNYPLLAAIAVIMSIAAVIGVLERSLKDGLRNIPLLTFLSRYWILSVLVLASACAALSEGIFQRLGALAYAPVLVLLATWLNCFVTHLWFRQTLDEDAHNGTYVEEWRSLSPRDRIDFSSRIRCAVFIGTAIIIHAVAK